MLGSGTASGPGLSSPEPGLLAETTSDEAESEGPNKWEAYQWPIGRMTTTATVTLQVETAGR